METLSSSSPLSFRAPRSSANIPPLVSHSTLQNLLRSGSAATFSQVLRMVVTFGTYIVLRRLVEPGPWGIWHWSEPLFLLLGQVRDLGLPGHVVRVESPRPYGTLLRVEVVWGAVCAVLVGLGAPFLAQLFEEPSQEVVWVVQALTLFLFFEGLAKVPLTWCEAELVIGRSVPAEVARNLTFAVLSIVLAYEGLGVWSLVVAHIAGAVVFAAVLWWSAWGRMKLHVVKSGRIFDPEFLKKGIPLMVMSLLVLLMGKIDPFILGLHFEAEAVGQYGLALFLSFLIAIYIALPVSRALYPALGGLQDDRVSFFKAYRLATLFLVAIEVLAAYGLFVNAETALRLFGGEAYVGMAPVLRILCFAPLIQPFSRCANDMLLHLHRDRIIILSSLLTLATLVGLGYYLSGVHGLEGMAIANLLPLGAALVAWEVYRINKAGFSQLFRELLVIYLLPIPLFALSWLVAGNNLWLRLGLSLLAAALSALIFTRRHLGEMQDFFRGREEMTQSALPEDQPTEAN